MMVEYGFMRIGRTQQLNLSGSGNIVAEHPANKKSCNKALAEIQKINITK
jgi:hypothetical protein